MSADWAAYRKCPVDAQPTGQPCKTLHAFVVDGAPSGDGQFLTEPHKARKIRSGGHTRCCRQCRVECHLCRADKSYKAETRRRATTPDA